MSDQPSRRSFEYDVYIGHPVQERPWARLLVAELSSKGLRCYSDAALPLGQSVTEELRVALAQSRALLVLWSESAPQATGLIDEIIDFVATLGSDPPQLLIPVMLGGPHLFQTAPSELRRRQGLVVGEDVYRLGPYSEDASTAIAQLAEEIERSLEAVSPQYSADAPVLALGRTARRAVDLASALLVARDPSESELRAAALIGALAASEHVKGVSTTKTIARGLRRGRDLRAVLADAAQSAGLRSAALEEDGPAENEATAIVITAAASRIADETGAGRIHLRHIMATGVHPSLPTPLLAVLGVTYEQLEREWAARILESPSEESGESWRAYLQVSGEASAPPRPPSARMHTDRWTTEDRLDYALYARAIAEFIRHPEAQPPMVVSIQAPWGQGKTSLMRMMQSELDPGHPDLAGVVSKELGGPSDLKPSELSYRDLQTALADGVPLTEVHARAVKTVWFNAWKYQGSEQIWAGLAHAILEQLPARLSRYDRERFWLRLQRTRIDPAEVRGDIHAATLDKFVPLLLSKVLLILGALLIAGLMLVVRGQDDLGVGLTAFVPIGFVWHSARRWSKASRQALERPLEGAYLRYVRQPDYTGRLGYLHLVEEDMRNALSLLTSDAEGVGVVVFIDDLDRCSPGSISEVIEAVNLFLAGEYPRCAFVIGMDAEVVAAAMEVVHAQIIEKLDDRRQELGWRFMDKFVQLPFVMPRLQGQQREIYLRGLFAGSAPVPAPGLIEEADALTAAAEADQVPAQQIYKRAGELTRQIAPADPGAARRLGEAAIARGARAFSDEDPEVVDALTQQLRYLSNNPRTIKRAVNLYRFHYFASIARTVSPLPLRSATPAEIGRWIVPIVRWPQFVRWLQTACERDASSRTDPAAKIVELGRGTPDASSFRARLREAGFDVGWTEETELLEYLREPVATSLEISRASDCGLW